MCQQPLQRRRRGGTVSAAFLLLGLGALSLALVPAVTAAAAAAVAGGGEDGLPEIMRVRGCGDGPAEARETTGCFASRVSRKVAVEASEGPLIASVKLSLQGAYLPAEVRADEGGSAATGAHAVHRILLQEHRSPPMLDATAGDAQESQPARIELTCGRPAASAVFPRQLVSCELANPLLSLGAVPEAAARLARLTSGPMWFDVRLEERLPGAEAFRPVALLRRAVELRVKDPRRDANPAGTPAEALRRQAEEVSWEAVREHPLERLYAPSRRASDDSSAADEDPYEGDPETSGEEVWVELGIGGLKRELRSLFRRVFLSRLPSLAPLAEALELQHVRGVILYGPPGNGKTLIARNLFRLLGPDTRLSIVNAADILSKYVGESEKNLRDVFEGNDFGAGAKDDNSLARMTKAWAGKGADKESERPKKAGLQVLVIDEFEALFRRRGHSSDESSAKAVYDGVTNTLLSLMDGVQSRNDLLVVGLTNRLQAIDQALLRPGRFEVLIEIPSPDVPGREDIFFIHTERLRDQQFLAPEVDLRELALESGGFSGSDIAGTVRSAVSYALLRYRRHGFAFAMRGGESEAGEEEEEAAEEEELIGHRASDVGGTGLHHTAERHSGGSAATAAFQVTRADFERAMKDIRSAKDEASALSQLSSDGDGAGTDVVDHDGTVSKNLERAALLMARVMQSDRTVTGMLAITGAPGTGKSTIARALTRAYDFTAVRYFSCRRLTELRDREEQLVKLRDALSEASHTERGLVVLDDYDVLVDAVGASGYAASTLRGLLYEYMHRPNGVSRALVADSPLAVAEEAGGEAEGGNMVVNSGSRVSAERNHRVLILTSTLPSALQPLTPDVHLRVHPVLRRGAVALLQEYRVANATDAAAVAAAYPVSMSYRTFLRITDMALQRWASELDAAAASAASSSPSMDAPEGSEEAGDGAGVELPAYFATSETMRSAYETLHAQQIAEDFYAVRDDGSVRAFASAVRATVANMGLLDPYQGWSGEGDGEADAETDGAAEGEGSVVDVDELVWMADELLW